jgi:hypothetical protein
MKRSKSLLPLAAVLFMIGASGLSHYSSNVRGLNVVGLSGAGFALGVGFVFLILELSNRTRP